MIFNLNLSLIYLILSLLFFTPSPTPANVVVEIVEPTENQEILESEYQANTDELIENEINANNNNAQESLDKDSTIADKSNSSVKNNAREDQPKKQFAPNQMISGLWTSVFIHEISGDFVGDEIIISNNGSEYFVAFQFCQGVPLEWIIAKNVKIKDNKISFELKDDAESEPITLKGTITPAEINFESWDDYTLQAKNSFWSNYKRGSNGIFSTMRKDAKTGDIYGIEIVIENGYVLYQRANKQAQKPQSAFLEDRSDENLNDNLNIVFDVINLQGQKDKFRGVVDKEKLKGLRGKFEKSGEEVFLPWVQKSFWQQ